MSDDEIQKLLMDIQKRIDVLIAFFINKELKNDTTLTMREVIKSLDSLGLKYTEIANIFGKSPTYIASEITKSKKRGEKNVRRKKNS